MLVAQIERDLSEDVLAAVASAGVDVLFVGEADLSVRLGDPTTKEVSARVAAVVDRVAATAEAAGIAFGRHGAERGPVVHTGGVYSTLTSDVVVLASGLRSVFRERR